MEPAQHGAPAEPPPLLPTSAIPQRTPENKYEKRPVFALSAGRLTPRTAILALALSLVSLVYFEQYQLSTEISPLAFTGDQLLIPHANSPRQASKYAYATLCVGDGIVDGVLVLFQSLRDVAARADFVALTYNVSAGSAARLHAFGVRTYPTSPVDIEYQYDMLGDKNMEQRDGILWSKLRVWQLVDYAKVVMMDADVFALKNVDELFAMPEISACAMAERREKIAFFKTGQYGMRVRNKVEKESSYILPGWSGLNSGVTVLEPKNATFSLLLNELSILPNRPCCPSQEFLYHFFDERKKFYRLPGVYNLRLLREARDNDLKAALRWAKIYHFLGEKPWKVESQSFFHRLWREKKARVEKTIGKAVVTADVGDSTRSRKKRKNKKKKRVKSHVL